MQTDTKRIIRNSKIADSSSKIIFEDNTLCAQFLRDYIDIPYCKEIRPEDIEDVSDQYVPLFAEERNADRVKRVRIGKENPFFLVSLFEHKAAVDFDVSMQIFRYMIHIWETYAKEAEKLHKRITKQADFKYPPILPIVYYEGSGKWTVPCDFKSRIIEGEVFEKYIPNFEYYLVPLQRYSNDELLQKKDEISLVMMINKMQTQKDIEEFRKVPAEKVDEILKETPEHLLEIISNILRAFLLKMNLPIDETEELVGKIKEKKMGYLFENMEKIDIQEERRKRELIRKEADEERQKAEAERQKAEAERQRAEAERQRAEAERQRAEEERQKAEAERRKREETEENAIRFFVEGYQELNISRELTLRKIMKKFEIEEQIASAKMKKYWKEQS